MEVAIKFIALITVQFLIGFGLVKRLEGSTEVKDIIPLSFVIGLPLSTFPVLVLDMIGIPIRYWSILGFLFVVAILFHVKFRNSWLRFKVIFGRKPRLKLYEIPFLLAILFLLGLSGWRCYYNPISPFDTVVGIDLVAKYAVKESTIRSTVFTDLLFNTTGWSNQAFYAPFTMLMQVIFRSVGFPFGKVWLIVLNFSFFALFYRKIARDLHPYFAGLFTVLLLSIPELYAYSYLIQTDYSNAIFFTLSLIFMYDFYRDRSNTPALYLSIVLMSMACWTRSETVFFLPIGLFILFYERGRWAFNWERVKMGILYLAFPLLTFFLWTGLYTSLFLPVSSISSGLLNLDFSNYFGRMISYMDDMFNSVILEGQYWNYLIPVFAVGALLNFLLFRNGKGIFFIWTQVFLLVVFTLMLLHIEGVNVAYTFRRGFFKFIPLMFFYFTYSSLFTYLSKRLLKFES